jgi:hypothetical protein
MQVIENILAFRIPFQVPVSSEKRLERGSAEDVE